MPRATIPGLIAITTFALALAGSAFFENPAHAAACVLDRSNPPSIRINVHKPEIRYFQNKGKKELANMRGQYHKPRAGWSPVGLTHGEMKLEIGIAVESSKRNDGRYCSRLHEVEVNVGFEVLDVYIAKEYARGTCQYGVVLAHERRHVLVYENAIKDYLPILDRQMRNEANFMRPAVSSDPGAVLNTFHQRLMGAVQRSFKKTQDSMVARNAAFDTVSAYRQEQKKCPKW